MFAGDNVLSFQKKFLFDCRLWGQLNFYPITRRQILDSSKLKEFADDNMKLDENGRQLSKRVENTEGH